MAAPLTPADGPSAFLPWQPSAFSWPSTSASWAHALAPLRGSLVPPWPPASSGAGGPPLSDVRWLLAAWMVYLPALAATYLVVGALGWQSRTRAAPKTPDASRSTVSGSGGKTVSTADAVAAAHNFALAAASAVMLGGVLTAGGRLVAIGRGADLFCTSPAQAAGVGDGGLAAVRYWLYLFYLSKFWELGDTFVLLARRKPLTLLHVWHHVSVMGETWAWLQFGMTLGAVGMAVNAGVHVLMYSYFGASVCWLVPLFWVHLRGARLFLSNYCFSLMHTF